MQPDRTKNEKLIEIERPPIVERVILARVALQTDRDEDVAESLAELGRLAWTAGGEVVATVVQQRDKPDPGYLFGRGKLEGIKAMAEELEADVLIVDCELSAKQGANIEDAIDLKVVDRTQLILDIFAQHAHTREGKLQVELAQLQYILPRLTGRGSIMRQQGGIGIRGPGEQKLEIDRRRIRERIALLGGQLDRIRAQRQVQRKNRARQAIGTVALVGYTNAGKSSLLNALTHAGVLVEDKLFATLDPRVRRLKLPSGQKVLLADTVGFVSKLPHGLVAAFRATLEQVTEADLLLLVIDAAHPAMEEQIDAVYKVLDEIGALELPLIKVYNKMDLVPEEQRGNLGESWRESSVAISARTGEGLEKLLIAVEERFSTKLQTVSLRIPQEEAGLLTRIHESGRILSQTYENNDILIEAELGVAMAAALAAYEVGAGKGVESAGER
jgi:GTP-binding protein HflX